MSDTQSNPANATREPKLLDRLRAEIRVRVPCSGSNA